jgi:hypothetical protein
MTPEAKEKDRLRREAIKGQESDTTLHYPSVARDPRPSGRGGPQEAK